MSITDQIIGLIKEYPTIFKNRFSVLHQWFCVNGNGLEWVNGELVDPYKDEDERNHTPHFYTDADIAKDEAEKYKWLEDDPDPCVDDDGDTWRDVLTINEMVDYLMESTYKFYLKENLKRDYTIANAEANAVSIESTRKRIYPLCEYACLAEIPDNIQDEWLYLAYEAIEMVLNTPVSDKYTEKEKNDNDAFVLGIKSDLYRRFK